MKFSSLQHHQTMFLFQSNRQERSLRQIRFDSNFGCYNGTFYKVYEANINVNFKSSFLSGEKNRKVPYL